MSLTSDDTEDIKQLLVANNRSLLIEVEHMLDEKLEQKLEEKLEQKLEQKFEEKLKPIRQDITDLSGKFDDLSEFVREAIDVSNDANGEQLANHERRITKLEQAAA